MVTLENNNLHVLFFKQWAMVNQRNGNKNYSFCKRIITCCVFIMTSGPSRFIRSTPSIVIESQQKSVIAANVVWEVILS